mmetsp:Transcript_43724/g.86230  ORF Transcript_43724/g.86230 Transcript_43724/m.86230 type:complete len:199 (-) Transcript_43724:1031-1627(-)
MMRTAFLLWLSSIYVEPIHAFWGVLGALNKKVAPPPRTIEPETETRPIVFYNPAFARHKAVPGTLKTPYHPEQPARVLRSEAKLRDTFGDRIAFRDPGKRHDADKARAVLEKVHSKQHLEKVETLSARGGGLLDWQTYCNAETYGVALLGVSAWLESVDVVLGGQGPAFALARPPGHHATPTEAMGFCVFCNAAAAVQ